MIRVRASAPKARPQGISALRVLSAVLLAGIFLFTSHILLILFTGGYSVATPLGTIAGSEVGPPILILLALVLLRIPVRHRALSWQVFFSHDAAILFSIFLMAYLSNGKTLSAPDTLPARCLPLSILQGKGFTLDDFPHLYQGEGTGRPYYLQYVKGHWVSDYPVGAALLALPVYVPSALGRVNPEGRILIDLEKLSAAAIVALSAVVLYAALRRLTSPIASLVITAVYGLGSSSLSVSSQALWQHGASQLALTVSLYCLLRGRREPGWVPLAGFPLAFAVVSRPTDALIAIPLGAYVLLAHPAARTGFLLSGLAPMGFQLWYNITYFGDAFRTQFPLLGIWTTPFWEGLSGILLSPGRGLLIYSPVFVFSLVGMGRVWRRDGDPLFRCLSIGTILTIVLYSKYVTWWGGWTFGPRLLADLTPILALFLYPVSDRLLRDRALKVIFVILALWSVAAHAIGTSQRVPHWNADVDGDRFPHHLWSWTDNQLINPPRAVLNRTLIALRGLPTSRRNPELLSASYRLQPPIPGPANGSFPIRLSLEATNTGKAAWLASPADDRGAVGLGWRWIKGGQEIPGLAGRLRLRYDVFPRRSYEFRARIQPPREAGIYLLEVGLVSEFRAWFSDLGVPPVRLHVTISPDGQATATPLSRDFRKELTRPASKMSMRIIRPGSDRLPG